MAAYQLSKSGAQIEKALDDATKVVANPSTTASAELNKITIGETTYSVEGSGETNVFYFDCAVESLDTWTLLPIAETPTRQEVYEAIVAGKTVIARAKIQNREEEVTEYNYYAHFVGCFGVSAIECALYYITDEMVKLDGGYRDSKVFTEE